MSEVIIQRVLSKQVYVREIVEEFAFDSYWFSVNQHNELAPTMHKYSDKPSCSFFDVDVDQKANWLRLACLDDPNFAEILTATACFERSLPLNEYIDLHFAKRKLTIEPAPDLVEYLQEFNNGRQMVWTTDREHACAIDKSWWDDSELLPQSTAVDI